MNMLHFEEYRNSPDGARVFRTLHCPPFKVYETLSGTYLEVYYAGMVNEPVPSLLRTSYDHAKVYLLNQIHNMQPKRTKEDINARKLDS